VTESLGFPFTPSVVFCCSFGPQKPIDSEVSIFQTLTTSEGPPPAGNNPGPAFIFRPECLADVDCPRGQALVSVPAPFPPKPPRQRGPDRLPGHHSVRFIGDSSVTPRWRRTSCRIQYTHRSPTFLGANCSSNFFFSERNGLVCRPLPPKWFSSEAGPPGFFSAFELRRCRC